MTVAEVVAEVVTAEVVNREKNMAVTRGDNSTKTSQIKGQGFVQNDAE